MLDLFLISFVSLYFEILFIRWLPGQVHLLGFFKNIVLLSAFSGLGIGCLYRKNKDSSRISLFTFLLFILISCLTLGSVFLHTLSFSLPQSGFYLWGDTAEGHSLTRFAAMLLFLSALYSFVLGLFFILGRELGFRFSLLHPLTAYTVNLIASLAGILSFTAFSAYSTPPFLWFLFGFLFLFPLFRFNKVSFFSGMLFCILCLVPLAHNEKYVYWSPYYKIQVSQVSPQEYDVSVNGYWHQFMFKFPEKPVTAISRLRPSPFAHYALPYLFGNRKNVLVLGSGTGNDVKTALLYGVKTVDAVEIDPLILRIGKTLHPDAPYNDPRVRVINDDARSFLGKTKKKYDLITFGFLDSHAAFSQMHSLRLDNFVYTLESFKTAKSRLSPDGLLVLSFAVAKPWVRERLEGMLSAVFNKKPLLYASPGMITFVTGNAIHVQDSPAARKRTNAETAFAMIPATDDWPHLYLYSRMIPVEYLALVFLLPVITILFYSFSGNALRGVKPHFFFLGCAFMLIEAKSITQLALLFGSTWQVNTIVIALVLAMALAANIMTQKTQGNDTVKTYKAAYFLIFLCLGIQYTIPLSGFLAGSRAVKILIAGFNLFPVFLSGLVFSASLKRESLPQNALGANFLGAVAGGFIEYVSLIYGINFMTLLVMFFYLLSGIALNYRKSKILFKAR